MTTRVTPSSASRSASTSSERVIVAWVRTSCSRLPGVSGRGTRTQHTSSALPISSAAIRPMSSSVSLLSSSTRPPCSPTGNSTAARRSRKGQAESDPRAQGNTEGPTARLPASDLAPASPTKEQRRQRATSPIFSPERASRREIKDLAHHFGQAGPDSGMRPRAVHYGLAAAEQALQARALGDAEARFHLVLGLLDDPATLAAPERIAALCGLGEAQRDQGNPEFRTTLLEAGRLAQASGDVPMLVRAVLANSRGLPSVIGAVDADRVAITEAALESLGPQPTAERARLLAQLAAELCFAGDHRRRVELSDEAEDIARSLGESGLLAWVLNRTGYAAFAPDRVQHLVARGEEATRLSDAVGDPAQRVLSRFYWSGALLTAGDLTAFRQVTEAMLAVSSDAAPTLQWFAWISQARVALLEGRFDDAQRINDDALQQAQDLQEADGTSWWGSIAMPLAMLRGDTAAVVDAIGDFSGQYPVHPGWWVTYAVSLATVGRVEEAREVLNQRSPDPEELADSVFPVMAISGLAAVCPYLEDDRLAVQIAETLRPY